MRLQDRAQSSARLGSLTDKAGSDLESLLNKWFVKHFIKGIKLQVLKSMHGTEAQRAFEASLSELPEADVIAVVRKVDPYRKDVLVGSRSDLIEHLRRLSSGEQQPARKPATSKASKSKAKKDAAGGVLSQARQG